MQISVMDEDVLEKCAVPEMKCAEVVPLFVKMTTHLPKFSWTNIFFEISR